MIYPNQLRKIVLKMVYEKQSGHIGSCFSIAEIIAYLYNNFEIHSNKHQLILSKGHAVPIIYAALYLQNILSNDDLNSFREIDSKLQGHPYSPYLPEHIHATTGSLGQGLSISIGKAIALKKLNLPYNIFCILGDGEIQEGQIWEGFIFAPKEQLNNLIVFIDVNGHQSDGELIYGKDCYLNKLPQILTLFGWSTIVIDGHDLHQIKNAINNNFRCPICIIANTIKGKGVSFMENQSSWHSKSPTKEEFELALQELDND